MLGLYDTELVLPLAASLPSPRWLGCAYTPFFFWNGMFLLQGQGAKTAKLPRPGVPQAAAGAAEPVREQAAERTPPRGPAAMMSRLPPTRPHARALRPA